VLRVKLTNRLREAGDPEADSFEVVVWKVWEVAECPHDWQGLILHRPNPGGEVRLDAFAAAVPGEYAPQDLASGRTPNELGDSLWSAMITMGRRESLRLR
jgi:hypothetical protein